MGALDWLSDHATELITGRDPDQERAAAAAGAAGDSARSNVYGQQAQLRADLPYGTDPASITTVDNWASWSHPQIKAMVDGLGSGVLHDAAHGWDTLGKSIESKFGDFKAEMAQIVTTGWEGQAADAATASTTSYAQHAASVGTAARYMGTKVTEAATGAEQTRAMVPEPVSFSVAEGLLTSIANPLLGAADIYKQRTAQNEAHAAAVRVMTSVYTPVYQQSDAGIPTLEPSSSSSTQPGAPAPTPPGLGVSPSNQSEPSATGSPPRGATHSSWTGPTSSSPSGTLPSNPANPGSSGLAAAPPAGAASLPNTSTGPAGGQWQPVDPAPLPSTTVLPAQIGSASWTPPVSAAGSVGGSSGYGFGDSGGPGAGGLGGSGYGSTGSGAYGRGGYDRGARGRGGSSSGAGGSGGSGSGAGAGASGPGGVGSGPGGSTGAGAAGAGAGSGTAAGAGSTVAGGAAGARGAAGGGMGAGGRGARGEEDFEHNTPSYLITEENGSELVGELPRVAPAVIGE